jgi:hypothetical protein
MDSGDIIYLLLMIGAIIVSIVKKKLDADKPIAQPQKKVPETLNDPFPDFKNWMDDAPEQPEPVNTEKILVHQPEKSEPATEPIFTYDSLDPNDIKTLIKDKKATLLYNSETLDSQEAFHVDLRQAVIYQAILHRPDY